MTPLQRPTPHQPTPLAAYRARRTFSLNNMFMDASMLMKTWVHSQHCLGQLSPTFQNLFGYKQQDLGQIACFEATVQLVAKYLHRLADCYSSEPEICLLRCTGSVIDMPAHSSKLKRLRACVDAQASASGYGLQSHTVGNYTKLKVLTRQYKPSDDLRQHFGGP